MASSSAATAENYEHVLTCLICRSPFDEHEHQPKFVPCHHTFCKACLAECVRQCGDEIECPSCRKLATVPAAGVAALQTNFYVHYVQQLVSGGAAGPAGRGGGGAAECPLHPPTPRDLYCADCRATVCRRCRDAHAAHQVAPLSAAVAAVQRDLDTAFGAAGGQTARLRAALEATAHGFAAEKDAALMRIEAAAERHAHTLARRTTLLKNTAIAIYAEHARTLAGALEEVATAATCLVSLKEHHEGALRRGEPAAAALGAAEMHQVALNVCEHVAPPETHIVYEERHGGDRFRACVLELGRVSSRPSPPPAPHDGASQSDSDDVFHAAAQHAARPKSLPATAAGTRSRSNIAKPVARKTSAASPQYDMRASGTDPSRPHPNLPDDDGRRTATADNRQADGADGANTNSNDSSPHGDDGARGESGVRSSVSDADDYDIALSPCRPTRRTHDADNRYQLVYTSYDDEQLTQQLSRMNRADRMADGAADGTTDADCKAALTRSADGGTNNNVTG